MLRLPRLLTCMALAVVLLAPAPARADDVPAVPDVSAAPGVDASVPAVVPADQPSGDGVTALDPVPLPPAPPLPPVQPAKPSKPSKPGKPSKPAKPSKPSKPDTAGATSSITCDQALAGKPGLVSGTCTWPTVPMPPEVAPAVPRVPTLPLEVATTTDQAAVAAAQAKVDALRREVATAEARVEQAAAANTAAQEASRQADWEELTANVRADQARLVLDRYAAGIYRSGSGTTGLVAIVNGSLDDPGQVLDEQAFLRRTSGERLTEVEAAHAVLSEAAEYAQAAAQARRDAAAADALAQQARTELTSALDGAKDELATAQSAVVSAQTLIGPDGCPTQVPANTLRGTAAGMNVSDLCARSVAAAATPEAALAIKFAFRSLGAPYACGGAGRSLPFRFDCSSLISRAYFEGAGLNTAQDGWAPSTRDLVPWDGVRLAPWADYVAPEDARPGDLVLYDTGGATYRHVVMLVADGLMLHTNSCGDVAKVEDFWGFGNGHGVFLVSRRVNPAAAR